MTKQEFKDKITAIICNNVYGIEQMVKNKVELIPLTQVIVGQLEDYTVSFVILSDKNFGEVIHRCTFRIHEESAPKEYTADFFSPLGLIDINLKEDTNRVGTNICKWVFGEIVSASKNLYVLHRPLFKGTTNSHGVCLVNGGWRKGDNEIIPCGTFLENVIMYIHDRGTMIIQFNVENDPQVYAYSVNVETLEKEIIMYPWGRENCVPDLLKLETDILAFQEQKKILLNSLLPKL